MDYFRKKQTIEDSKTGIDRKIYRLREEISARKRNEEYHKELFWNNVIHYYKTSNAQASKYNAWASLPVNSINPEHEKEMQKKDLEKRRVKLAQLLASEQEQYEKELKESRLPHKQEEILDNSVLKQMLLDVNQKLSQQKEESRLHAAVAQKYQNCKTMLPLYQYVYQQNNLELSEIGDVDICQKEEERKQDFGIDQKKEFEVETKKEAACEKKQKETSLTKQAIEQLERILLLCMEEMRVKNQTSQELKQEEMRNIKLKTKFEGIVIRRNLIEEQKRSLTKIPITKQQYHLQLKQKTKEVQNELEEDKRLMNIIMRYLKQGGIDNVINKETKRKIEEANNFLTELTVLEKQRKRALEFMFSEEARNMWLIQDVQWDDERKTRNELMRDILSTIQSQIKEKLRQNIYRHKNLIEEKDDLLRKIEDICKRLKTFEEETCNK